MMRIRTPWADWPEEVINEPAPRPPAYVDDGSIRVTHIIHSTVLIQAGGINILTDPIYSERCSPVSFAGPKRVRKPGIKFEDLPKIDIVLISHDHYDHLDLPTIKKLMDRDQPKFYMGLGVGEHLESLVEDQELNQNSVQELDWWERLELDTRLSISFVPVQHFSGRTLTDRNTTLWGGFVVELDGRKIYFGGDTGYADHFKQTRDRFGPMDLSLLPIGAYAPRDFMRYAHLDPKEAVKAHQDLGSKKSIGIHYGSFHLTAEPIDEPPRLLRKELIESKIDPNDFQALGFGQPLILLP